MLLCCWFSVPRPVFADEGQVRWRSRVTCWNAIAASVSARIDPSFKKGQSSILQQTLSSAFTQNDLHFWLRRQITSKLWNAAGRLVFYELRTSSEVTKYASDMGQTCVRSLGSNFELANLINFDNDFFWVGQPSFAVIIWFSVFQKSNYFTTNHILIFAILTMQHFLERHGG